MWKKLKTATGAAAVAATLAATLSAGHPAMGSQAVSKAKPASPRLLTGRVYNPPGGGCTKVIITASALTKGGFEITVRQTPSRTPLRSVDGGKTWQELPSPPSGMAPALRAPSDPSVLYRPINWHGNGLFERSDDGGRTWHRPKFLVDGLSIRDLAARVKHAQSDKVGFSHPIIHPQHPHWVYSVIHLPSFTAHQVSQVIHLAGIYVSRDGGDTWTRLTDAVHPYRVFTPKPFDVQYADYLEEFDVNPLLAIDPTSPNVMYAQSAHSLMKSTDGGKHWFTLPVSAVLLAPVKLYMESPSERRHREATGLTYPFLVYKWVFDPSEHNILYIVSSRGVIRSADAGKNWCPLDLKVNSQGALDSRGLDWLDMANSLVVNPANPRQIFVGTVLGLLRSDNAGAHFKIVLPSTTSCPAFVVLPQREPDRAQQKKGPCAKH